MPRKLIHISWWRLTWGKFDTVIGVIHNVVKTDMRIHVDCICDNTRPNLNKNTKKNYDKNWNNFLILKICCIRSKDENSLKFKKGKWKYLINFWKFIHFPFWIFEIRLTFMISDLKSFLISIFIKEFNRFLTIHRSYWNRHFEFVTSVFRFIISSSVAYRTRRTSRKGGISIDFDNV